MVEVEKQREVLRKNNAPLIHLTRTRRYFKALQAHFQRDETLAKSDNDIATQCAILLGIEQHAHEVLQDAFQHDYNLQHGYEVAGVSIATIGREVANGLKAACIVCKVQSRNQDIEYAHDAVRLRKVKKANGQIIACNEIFEKDDTTVKNYGVWIRYQSRVGFHNAYKEYRETTMNAAVDALYTEMASRHRVRSHALQIIKIAEVANEDVRRENTRQFLADDVSFPVVRKTLRHDSKSQKTTFKYQRPNFAIL